VQTKVVLQATECPLAVVGVRLRWRTYSLADNLFTEPFEELRGIGWLSAHQDHSEV
jgi:hypothetical protein